MAESYLTRYDTKYNRCGCEHYSHFGDSHYGPQTGHDYGTAPAGYLAHPWVGGICNECAAGCLSVYSENLTLATEV